MQFRAAVVPAEMSEYEDDKVLSCVSGLYVACYVDMYSICIHYIYTVYSQNLVIHRWPADAIHKGPVMRSIDLFSCCQVEHAIEQTAQLPVIRDVMIMLMWGHCKAHTIDETRA